MKNIQKLVYIYVILLAFASCQTLDLETVPPNSVVVRQGNTNIQDQSTVIEYGTHRVLKDSVTKNFMLTHSKNQILRYSEITSDSPDFIVTVQKDSSILYPTQSLPFSVTYAPTLGGESIGKISFSTNDPAFPVFSFNVKGFGVAPPEIIGNNTPQFDELNTIPIAGGDNGTLFTVEVYVEDPYERISPSSLQVEVEAIFSSRERLEPVLFTPIEISQDNKRIFYTFPIRFGESNFVDLQTRLVLGNGDISNTFQVRVEKPNDAN